MQFIKKQPLKEDYSKSAEEKEVTTGSKDADYKQAILTAIGSETGAWNEYNTILEMEKDVSSDLVEHFHNTIEDIRNEEMKHIGQLTEKASELPDMKDAYEAGKKEAEEGNEESLDNNEETEEKPAEEPVEEKTEEVKESVQLTESVVEKIPDNTRMFDSDTIFEIILNNFDPTPDAETVIYRLFDEGEELTAAEVDEKLAKVQAILNISPENMEALEVLVIQSKDPVVDRVQEFRLDIENDIGLIRNAIEDVNSQAAVTYLQDVIEKLQALEYNGDKNIGWQKSNTIYGDNPTKKVLG